MTTSESLKMKSRRLPRPMKTMSSIITLMNTDFGTLLRWSLFTRNDNPNGTTMNSRMYFRTSRGFTESPRRVLVISGVSPMAQM